MANTLIAPLAQSAATTSQSKAQNTTDPPNKELFLQLMVAQLKNQNPLNPVDGVDFLNQLSQISGVEQMVEMRRELEAIHKIIDTATTTQTAAADGSN